MGNKERIRAKLREHFRGATPPPNGKARPEEQHRRAADDDEPWAAPIPLPKAPSAAPFPLEVLPRALQEFVRDTAWALNCPTDYVAVPLLVLAGAAVGATRAIEIKATWRERPALYAAVVAPPSSSKSPALRAVAAPLYDAQAVRHRSWKSEMQAWAERDEEGARPMLETLFVRDTTTEALGHVLEQNPRGVAAIHDELTAWVGGLDQYRARGRGADRQFYLSAWAGEPITVHRKNQEDGPLFIQHPFLSVVGAMPPDCLENLRGAKNAADGFLDRLLFSFPEPLPSIAEDWRSVSEETMAAWTTTLGKLWALTGDGDGDDIGNPRPRALHLNATGRKAWERFTQALANEMNSESFPDALRGPFAKFRGYGARLSLILHLLHGVALGDAADAAAIDADDVDRAAALIAYFASHARKVYAALGADADLEACRRILEWIQREKPATFRPWELHRDVKNQGMFPKIKDLEGPLARLMAMNYLRQLPQPDHRGPGRPGAAYAVNPALRKPAKTQGK